MDRKAGRIWDLTTKNERKYVYRKNSIGEMLNTQFKMPELPGAAFSSINDLKITEVDCDLWAVWMHF